MTARDVKKMTDGLSMAMLKDMQMSMKKQYDLCKAKIDTEEKSFITAVYPKDEAEDDFKI